SFDARDSVSDNQHGFNLPVVASGGFVRSCIYDCEEVINIKYGGDRIAEFWDWDDVPESDNPRNRYNYKGAFFDGRDITAPFGFNYFDQEGQLWCIEEISKAVTLVSEDEEATTEFYVSH
ncbi:MAG: hypothetical protein P8M13_06265, partial [Luminiphilus sp.]|nr:hypothetical protein [Luminiphilus sp.]